MPKITSVSVKHDQTIYTVVLSWDEEAFAGGEFAFTLTARIVDAETGRVEHEHSSSVHLEPVADGQPPDLVVKLEGRELFRDNLSNLIGEDSVLDSIPRELFGGGNPVVGCLVRAGLAACISQILDCKDQTAGREWLYPRMRAIGSCLNEHGRQIAGRMLLRAGRCVLLG